MYYLQIVSVQFCKCGYKPPVCEMECEKRRKVAAIEHVAYPPLETLQNAGPSSDFGWGRDWSSVPPELCQAWNIYRSWGLRLDDYIFIFSLDCTYKEAVSRLWLKTRTRLMSESWKQLGLCRHGMSSDLLVPVAFSGIQHQPQSKIWTIRGNKVQHAKVMLKITW